MQEARNDSVFEKLVKEARRRFVDEFSVAVFVCSSDCGLSDKFSGDNCGLLIYYMRNSL